MEVGLRVFSQAYPFEVSVYDARRVEIAEPLRHLV